LGGLKGRSHVGNKGVDVDIILRWILVIMSFEVWTRLNWLGGESHWRVFKIRSRFSLCSLNNPVADIANIA